MALIGFEIRRELAVKAFSRLVGRQASPSGGKGPCVSERPVRGWEGAWTVRERQEGGGESGEKEQRFMRRPAQDVADYSPPGRPTARGRR